MLQALLFFVAILSFIIGAVILTPLGIILLGFGIYSWKELYPVMLRIARWSSQRQNFIPILIPVAALGMIFLIIGISVIGVFGFSGLSILLFVWLFFLWLFVFGLAALPIVLAIVVWIVDGVQWLWPHYKERFWSFVHMVSERLLPTSKSKKQDKNGKQ